VIPTYKVANEEHDKLRALLARVIAVEEIVENVDARRFEDLIEKLNSVKNTISGVSAI